MIGVIDTPQYILADMPQLPLHHETDVLIVGAGVTGLMAALRASTYAHVTLLTRDPLLKSNSAWAQGGIAAALDVADSPLLHIEDTLVAGAGLSDRAAAEVLAWEAPCLMYELAELGVPFERENGVFALGLEGSHSCRRILHVGDKTGLALTDALVQHVRHSPHIEVLEGYKAVDLICESNQCHGLLALDNHGALHRFLSYATILATGGAGALYGLTSNQPGAVGEGIAIAYRAGAEVVDMEFMQFHPTVLHTKDGQGFLISEATRGEGGKLITPGGHRFMPAYHPRAELAPRDVVTRGIFDAMRLEGVNHVFLDLTHLSREFLERRFPTIYARCRAEGIDPAIEPIPVAPAAHYFMGGIRTNLHGATHLLGLYAAGECACTGVHGANRLASNSLLECLVTGSRSAVAAQQHVERKVQNRSSAERKVHNIEHKAQNELKRKAQSGSSAKRKADFAQSAWYESQRKELTEIMCTSAGPLRSAEGLLDARRRLAQLPMQTDIADPNAMMLANGVLVANLIVASALMREESRGAHYRTDFPKMDEGWRVHTVFQREVGAYFVKTVAEERYNGIIA